MTLALAIVGATLGILNTAIVLWQWQRSGPLVKVELRAGWMLPGGGIASHRAEAFSAQPVPGDSARSVVLVAATNRGRSEVDIREWWVTVGGAFVGMLTRVDPNVFQHDAFREIASELALNFDDVILREHNERCPFRLSSHATQDWVLPLETVAEAVKVLRGQDQTISAMVNLGDGRQVKSKQRIRPEDLGIAEADRREQR